MIKYILEIKNRLFFLFLTYCSIILVTYFYKEILLFLIIKPNYTFNKKSVNLYYFIFTAVTEIFSVYIQLIFFIGFQFFLIFLFYHMFIFFSSALFKKEYILLKIIFKNIVLIWMLSSFISHYIIIPGTWNFFLSFQDLIIKTDSFSIHFEAKIMEYLYFYIYLYYICCIYFQVVTLFFFFLNYINISLKSVKKYRKLYFFGFVIFSTLLSPDVISQILVSFILIVVYEIFIIFIIFSKKLKNLFCLRQPIKTY
jgi:Sec-independent protein secretion pathway component TatC